MGMDAKALIKRQEGLRLKPYRCPAGKLTIGYGRNLDDKGISELEASFLFTSDFYEAQASLADVFPKFWSWPENTRAALTSMMFNLGKAGFLAFRKMIGAAEREDWNEVVAQIRDSAYAGQVPNRVEEICALILRRGA
jgi:lysozyme